MQKVLQHIKPKAMINWLDGDANRLRYRIINCIDQEKMCELYKQLQMS